MVTYYSDEILKNIYEIKRCYNTIQSKKEHFHKELSMALIEEGTTSTRFENKAYDFGYKNFIIIPPRLVHSCNPADINRWKFTMLYIDDDWFCNTFRTGIDGNMLFYCKLKEDEYAEIKTLLSYLGKNTDHIDKESLLIEIINRYYLQRNTAFSNIALEPFAKKEIKRVKLYIEDNVNGKLSLRDLSNISGLSKYHMIRAFKKMYHVSPLTYQRILRFNIAKKELRREASISQIALNLGYYDQSHFTKEFQRFSGTTPHDYRKNT